MNKDKYIFAAFIILFLYSVWTTIIINSELERLQDAMIEHERVASEQSMIQDTRISDIESHDSSQDTYITQLQIKNKTQDLRIAMNRSELLASTQRFDDIMHEVNSFEDAVVSAAPTIQLPTTWTGPKLSSSNGVVIGPSGRETYYNMDMSFCVSRMRSKGYSAKDYPYWVRDDGCKMLGKYIMVAANFRIRPLGTILETSRGWAIVVDTGGFVRQYPKGLDVATNW